MNDAYDVHSISETRVRIANRGMINNRKNKRAPYTYTVRITTVFWQMAPDALMGSGTR